MSHKLNQLLVSQGKSILEVGTNLCQDGAALIRSLAHSTALGSSSRLLGSGSAGPQADTIEGLADVDDNTHDLVVSIILELLTNSSKEDAQPDVVVGLALLESVGPTTTVLVLRVFPLGSHATLEEVVVGLLGELRGGSNVVLFRARQCECLFSWQFGGRSRDLRRYPRTLRRCQS